MPTLNAVFVGKLKTHPAHPKRPPTEATTRYEYFVHYFGSESTHGEEFVAKMNELGAQGYALMGVEAGTMYFMRVVTDG